jgi:hypothetical protein
MQITGFHGNNPHMQAPMSEEQQARMQEILAKYDPESATREDLQSMRQELFQAGIPRSRQAMDMLKDAGFGPGMPLGHGTGRFIGEGADEAEIASAQQMRKGQLWDLYKQFQAGEISDAEFMNLVKNQVASGSIMDLTF